MGCCHSKTAVDQFSSIVDDAANKEQSSAKNISQDPKNECISYESIVGDAANKEQSSAINISQGPKKEFISYESIIEIDMHGLDPNIKDHYEWVSHIRATLDSAIANKIDFVRLIPGQGNNSRYRPLLRPLVLLTTKMHGFDCYCDENNKGRILVDIKENHYLTQNDFDLHYRLTPNEKSLIKLFNVYPNTFNNINPEIFNTISSDNSRVSKQMKIKRTYLQLRNLFPELPSICQMILASNFVTIDGAKKMAKKFLKYYNNEEISEKNQALQIRLTNEMKFVAELETHNKYKLYGSEFNKHVAKDNSYNLEKCVKIFNRVDEIPDSFYRCFMELAEEHKNLSIEHLLDYSREWKYDEKVAKLQILGKSKKSLEDLANIKNIYRAVDSIRKITDYQMNFEGPVRMPKIVPIIKIDLNHAVIKMAKKSIKQIIVLLKSYDFSCIEISCREKNNLHYCNLDQIKKLFSKNEVDEVDDDENVYETDQINLHEIEIIPRKVQKPDSFAFYISSIEINEETEEEEEENDDDEDNDNDDDND